MKLVMLTFLLDQLGGDPGVGKYEIHALKDNNSRRIFLLNWSLKLSCLIRKINSSAPNGRTSCFTVEAAARDWHGNG